MNTLLAAALFTLPIAAQVSRIVPPATVNIGQMTSAALPYRPANALRGMDRESAPGRTLYGWSLAAVLAANAADVASSWHGQEANPFVAGGRSEFGITSVAIKSGFVATSLVIQHVALRHRPDLYNRMAWMNFATAGLLGGVAKYNMGVK